MREDITNGALGLFGAAATPQFADELLSGNAETAEYGLALTAQEALMLAQTENTLAMQLYLVYSDTKSVWLMMVKSAWMICGTRYFHITPPKFLPLGQKIKSVTTWNVYGKSIVKNTAIPVSLLNQPNKKASSCFLTSKFTMTRLQDLRI